MEETGAPADPPAQSSPANQPTPIPAAPASPTPPTDATSAPAADPTAPRPAVPATEISQPGAAAIPADHVPWQRPTAPVPPEFRAPAGSPGHWAPGAMPQPGFVPPDGMPAGAWPPAGYPPQGQIPGQIPPPPPGAPAPFSAPPPKFPRWAVVTVVVVAVLALVGSGIYNAAVGFRRAQDQFDTLEARDRAATEPHTPFGTGPATDPSESVEPSPTGPRAATYPVRDDDDLARVCDGWYYPQSPKFTGKAPHQISVGVIDSVLMPSRHIMAAVTVPDLRESVWRAWIPEKPGATQLVACVDLTRSGSKLKSCKYDDPKPETIDMKQGFYRLRLYEAATGKKLFDKPLTGEDEKCPIAVFLAQGESLYSEVDDRQLYELLKGFVMKKM